MAVELWTACLFCTTVMHAHILGVWSYECMFSIVATTSVFCYATNTTLPDVVAKYAAMIFMLMEQLCGKEWLLIFPICVAFIWASDDHNPSTALNAALHLTAVAGVHMYLHMLH
jgi:hypothetical protein